LNPKGKGAQAQNLGNPRVAGRVDGQATPSAMAGIVASLTKPYCSCEQPSAFFTNFVEKIVSNGIDQNQSI
jgi:hypothetical protein